MYSALPFATVRPSVPTRGETVRGATNADTGRRRVGPVARHAARATCRPDRRGRRRSAVERRKGERAQADQPRRRPSRARHRLAVVLVAVHRRRRGDRRHLHRVASLVRFPREQAHRDQTARAALRPHIAAARRISRPHADGSADEPRVQRPAADPGLRGDDPDHCVQPDDGAHDRGRAGRAAAVARARRAGAAAVPQRARHQVLTPHSSGRAGSAGRAGAAGHRGGGSGQRCPCHQRLRCPRRHRGAPARGGRRHSHRVPGIGEGAQFVPAGARPAAEPRPHRSADHRWSPSAERPDDARRNARVHAVHRVTHLPAAQPRHDGRLRPARCCRAAASERSAVHHPRSA